MTAQIANGGYKIVPQIIADDNNRKNDLEKYIKFKTNSPDEIMPTDILTSNIKPQALFRNQENINFIKDAMYAATNEIGGTSYKSRFKNKEFMFAGKTGSSQVKRFTQEQREAEVKQKELEYLDRDHALFVAFAPVIEPKYAISVLIEHGGSGSSAAAPIAKKIIKRVLKRHNLRKSLDFNLTKKFDV